MANEIKKYHEGEIILCKVTDIVRTTVFVETEDGVKGSIVFSEVAPGRIRNIREYAVPNKMVACKILKIGDNHLFLSLRRVKGNEKQELLQDYKKEKILKSVFEKIIGKDAEKIIEKIKKEQSLADFFEQAKENPDFLEKYFNKKQIQELSPILKEKKEKEKEIKKEFKLSCNESDGITRLKKILSQYKNVAYLGSSKFQIKIKSVNLKQADNEIAKTLEAIEKQAKKEKCEFSAGK